MATGETGFDDVTYDLISVQYHSLKAGHDYGQYVRDARTAGKEEIASFFEQVMKEDSERAGAATSSWCSSAPGPTTPARRPDDCRAGGLPGTLHSADARQEPSN
jgi:hypothetical protein